GGTGLGLTISARLVGMMGGQLGVRSVVDRGSTFHFTSRFGQGPALPPEASGSPALRGLRGLVAGANAPSRAVFAESPAGGRLVPTAADGGSAAGVELERAAAAGEPFPLVVLDAGMPPPDGFELAGLIRNRPGLAGPAVLLLSSPDRPGDVARCRELGVTSYLAKPVKPSDLVEALQRLLAPGAVADAPERPGDGGYPRPARPLRVLLAEDNLVNQKLAVRLLEKEGHSVVVA